MGADMYVCMAMDSSLKKEREGGGKNARTGSVDYAM